MFLSQEKISQQEWLSIERPIESDKERQVLNIINNGYYDSSVCDYTHKCINDYTKLGSKYDDYIFDILLKPILDKCNKDNILNIDKDFSNVSKKATKGTQNFKHITKPEKIKLEQSLYRFQECKTFSEDIVEYIILKQIKSLAKCVKDKNKKHISSKYIYNINYISETYDEKINRKLVMYVEQILATFIPQIDYNYVLKNVDDILEHNIIHDIAKIELHDHQKRIYDIFGNYKSQSRFIWYCAPTASGKTLTPIGLSNEYKIIFMCASKHVGVSLAKSAFHCGKKIGFAFGCNDTDDIRLHYNTINSYITKKNKSNNKIEKRPDHSDGTKVELMVCDIHSFESAMLYMKAFNHPENIILYWDEPTIGLDVQTHPLHHTIRKNWKINVIPNVVFSCATLPKTTEVKPIIDSFRTKFDNAQFFEIHTHDHKSNLMLYDEHANILTPHMVFKNVEEMRYTVLYQGEKYFKFYNCTECAKFILYYQKYFDDTIIADSINNVHDIDMHHIKNVYFQILTRISSQDIWDELRTEYFKQYPLFHKGSPNPFLEIGTELTTKSAHSLTNGPTLYFTNNTMNVCKYLLHISDIEQEVIKEIEGKIQYNTKLKEQIQKKTKIYEDKIAKYKDNDKVMTDLRIPQEILDIEKDIQTISNRIQQLTLDAKYVPNTKDHYQKWCMSNDIMFNESDVFCGNVCDDNIENVINDDDVDLMYKMLLLLNIGVFNIDTINHSTVNNSAYIDEMKTLADSKSLYTIIANSDYIYGMNYQFSHCYLGKDMREISQEKIIQCIGRVGRQDKNKHFSFRFRSQDQINTLFSVQSESIETTNMNVLFC
jgi:hypothetical protein